MAHAPPLLWSWDAEALAMRPRPAFVAEAMRQFVAGGIYRLGEIEQRSLASEGHQFAWLKEAWRNLPEAYAQEMPSPEHLRKWALIQAGYFNQTIIDVGSNAIAIAVADVLRGRSEFAHVVARDGLVVMREAKSQSRREMDKEEFQASKTAIMEIVAGMIGVTSDQLQANAGRAA